MGTITAGNTTTTIDVTINGDTNIETDETFDVVLSNISANATIADGTGIGTITDDDTPIPEIILISEVSVCDQQVELFNAGTTTVDISLWRLCNFPQYDALNDPSVTLISGSLNLTAGSYVTVGWPDIDVSSGEIGLYLPTGGFGDPANIKDYVQYNSINNTRASVAVSAGVWDDAALDVTAPTGASCSTIIANASDPTSSNSTTWCEAAASTIDPAAANSNCDTGITCPNVGDIIVTEIMQNPTGNDDLGEWFEVYNTSGVDIDLEGWTISDLGSDNHTIANGAPLIVTANGYLVFGINANSGTNGGLTVDYEYSSFGLSNSDDEIVLTCDPLGAPMGIDTVAYDGGPTFPNPDGASITLNPANLDGVDNNTGANWCEATTTYGSGDLGTPGMLNTCTSLPLVSIDDQSLVEGNPGTSILTFTVTLSATAAADVTFDIDTQDGSATIADNDYLAIVSGNGTITAGNLTTTIDVTINGDAIIEADEDFGVLLSNVSANAVISDAFGNDDILDDDTPPIVCPNEGDIIITEIFNDASGADDDKEWFEVYNTSGSDIDINGWTISDLGSDDHTINNGGPLMVTSNAYLVLGQSTNMADNGGITVDYAYSGIALGNGDDELVLTCDPMGAAIGIDTVQYDGGPNFPNNSGSSISLNPSNLNFMDNDLGSNWCEGTSPFGTNGDLGTPSLVNDACPTPPELSIDDVVMAEGNSGTTVYTFTITASSVDAAADITFDINTADGTATSPSDFTAIVATTGTITMGTLSTTVDVTVNGDTDLEPNEAFGVVISNVSANASILDGTGMGIINDDDNSCPTDYAGPNALTGTITGIEDYETDGAIESTQIIDATAVIDYDSATEINLNAEFEVVLGAVFSAFIDSCGGTMIQEENTETGKK